MYHIPLMKRCSMLLLHETIEYASSQVGIVSDAAILRTFSHNSTTAVEAAQLMLHRPVTDVSILPRQPLTRRSVTPRSVSTLSDFHTADQPCIALQAARKRPGAGIAPTCTGKPDNGFVRASIPWTLRRITSPFPRSSILGIVCLFTI